MRAGFEYTLSTPFDCEMIDDIPVDHAATESAAAQPSQPGIHVEILGIRNNIGAVACALFESPEGFPTEFVRFATKSYDGQSSGRQSDLRI